MPPEKPEAVTHAPRQLGMRDNETETAVIKQYSTNTPPNKSFIKPSENNATENRQLDA